MIVLLNLVWLVIVVGSFWLTFNLRKPWPLIIGLVILVGYQLIQPSYLPKGTVTRDVTPEFQDKGLEIEDRQPKPKSMGQYDEDRKNAIKDGLPFVDK